MLEGSVVDYEDSSPFVSRRSGSIAEFQQLGGDVLYLIGNKPDQTVLYQVDHVSLFNQVKKYKYTLFLVPIL